MSKDAIQSAGPSIVSAAMRSCRTHFVFATIFNVMVNVLLFAYPIFMFQVYQRVTMYKREETLIVLFIGFALALLFKCVFQWARGMLFVRASLRLDRMLSDQVLTALIDQRSQDKVISGAGALRELDAFRQFATGKGAIAAIDAPWAAVFVGSLLLIDFAVGIAALCCIAVLTLATIANSLITKRVLAESNRCANQSYVFAEANLRCAEAIVGMGMIPAVVRKWRNLRDPALASQKTASEHGVLFSAINFSSRVLMQGVILSVATYQVVHSHAPIGIVFAAVIIFQFAMRPIEQLVTAWEDYVPARAGLKRIGMLLERPARASGGMNLPRPVGRLLCQGVWFVPPGQEQPILSGISVAIPAGASVGLVGLNGSGKTTFARLLVGALQPSRGTVRLDGADVFASDRENLGRYTGYLPQNVSLFAGSVAENIGRFGLFDESQIIEAAKLARVHDKILALPQGYDTRIGEGGHPLSGGQRQLIGLARAIAGSPAFVVLDEPNSNLDGPGEDALMKCIAHLREKRTTLVLISHRPNLVRDLDKTLVLRNGGIATAGGTGEVFQRLGRPVVVKSEAANG